jgi:putative ABC transport system permease protein
MFNTSLHNLLSHKVRLALTTLAIVLGVTFVAGTLVLTNTISNYSKSLIGGLDQGVAVQVQGSVNPLPGSVLARVQAVPGVAAAVGELNRSGIALLKNGAVIGGSLEPGALGGNWIADRGLSPYRLTSGSAPAASDDVVIDAESATFAHLTVGDVVQVAFTASAAQSFRISGIATYGSETSEGGNAFALFTLPTAEQLLQADNTYDAIAVSAQSSVTDLQLRDRIATALTGSAVLVQTGAAATAQTQQTAATTINQSLGTPLLIFAFISVFVGTFLIVNTFSILVAQRTRELALLRALGATRRQIFMQVITEAALTGVIASLIGFVLGIAVAGALLHLVASAVPLSIPLSALITSVLVGTIVTVIAAALPARRATRIPPVAALREAQPETQSLSRMRIFAGVVLLVGGVLTLVLSLLGASSSATPNLQVLGLSVLVVFLAMALLAPAVVRPLAGLLGWPIRLRGAQGRLAGENARRNPRRTAMTAAALMVGLALVTGVAVITDSLKASVDQAIDGNIRAQLVVFDKGDGSNFTGQVATTLRGDPAITDVAEIQGSSVQVGDIATNVDGIAPSSIGPDLVFPMVAGNSASLSAAKTGLVDSTTASTLNLHVGSTVTLSYPNGDAAPIRVGGIYAPDAVLSGFYVSAATFAPHVTPLLDSVVLANPAAGTTLAAADTSLLHDLNGYPVLTGYTADQYLNYESSQLNTFLNLIYVLLALAIVIAVVGIVNTLALSVLERTRELGLLRALGMTRGQVREMVAWESVIIALLGAALGLFVGAGLGIAMASSLHADGITATAVPGANLLLYAAAAACFGLIAAVFPAIRASRVNVLRAVTTE